MPDPEPVASGPSAPASPAGSAWRADAVAALTCVVLGTFLAVAPHLARLATVGHADYIADTDDLLYLAIGRFPYHGEPGLRDPFARAEEGVPSLYSWAQFVPLAWTTRALGLPPILMAIVWRLVGGSLLGLSTFGLFRALMAGVRRPTAWALGLSIAVLCDPGVVTGRTLIGSFDLLRELTLGAEAIDYSRRLGQYRVVTPLLTLPVLFGLIAMMLGGPGRRARWAVAAVLLGLLVHLYFFFWTAAVAALAIYACGLLASAGLDRGARRDRLIELAGVVAVVVVGLAIGLPQIVDNARTFAAPELKPILESLSRGLRLPAGDPMRLVYLGDRTAAAKLLIGAVAAIALRSRALGLVWCFAAAGYLLTNSAIVTGLEFENFHWKYITNPCAEVLLLAAAGLAIDRATRGWARRLAPLLWAVPVAMAAIAIAWRPFEALEGAEAAGWSRRIDSLRPLRPALEPLGPDVSLAGPQEASLALLWGRCGQLYNEPYTAHISVITDDEVHERFVLNQWLQGDRRAAMAAAARPRRHFRFDSPLARRYDNDAIVARRLAIFDRLEAGDPDGLVRKYRPDALLLPADAPDPTRGGPWERAATAGDWTLWVKPAAGSGRDS